MIQEINQTEIKACVEVIRKSFQTVAEEFNITPENGPRFTAFSTSEERLLWQLKNEQRPMFAYYDAEKIAGYYSLAKLEESICELNNLCVLPEYRHKHIGEELLEHAFAQAMERKYTKIIIGIVEENRRLRAWYEKYGFVHIGTKKFDFFPFTCGYMEKLL